MKRALLTGVATIAILLTAGQRHAANAVWGVADTTFCLNCVPQWLQEMEWVQDAARWGQQAKDMAQQIQIAQQNYYQAQATYHAFTNINGIGSAMNALNVAGIRSPLPINGWALDSVLRGQGSIMGAVSNIGSIYTGASTRNVVYAPQRPQDWVANVVNQRIQSATAAQAAGLAIHEEISKREAASQAIIARLNGAESMSPAERDTLRANLEAERTQIDRLHGQLTNVGIYSQNQREILAAQQEQQSQRSIDEALATVMGQIGPGSGI